MKKTLQKPFLIVSAMLVFTLLIACNSGKNKKNKKTKTTSALSTQNNNNILLDSNALLPFFKANKISDSVQKDVIDFYEERNYQQAWINDDGLTIAASNFYNQLQNYKTDFEDNRFMNVQLDSFIDNIKDDEKAFLKQTKNVEQLELLLTTTFFKYSKNVYGGITNDSKSLGWFIPRKKRDYQVLLDSLLSQNTNADFEEPLNKYYSPLKEKLKSYRVIEKNGGFSKTIIFSKAILLNETDSSIGEIKKHLFTTGDLKLNDKTNVFTDTLMAAVKHYQQRMGLTETGNIDVNTVAEMNKPIAARIKQIMVNMERLRWVPAQVEKDYLLINIPEFKLHVFENDKLAWETNVVVGKALTQTTIFKGNMSSIVLNPYWNVPYSIFKKEIKPRLTNRYLARNNMERYNGGVRQKPGKNNSLGKIKFLFPNNYNIYLHDTPSKSLFGETKRGFSHGCVRVQEPQKLAAYLLRKDANWNIEKMNTVLQTDIETPITLSPTIPVYIVYFTTWVDSAGDLNFRNDLYNLDEKLSKEIFGK
jgi:L,D-transpeptidase YcbB